jgi:hypothetical protein
VPKTPRRGQELASLVDPNAAVTPTLLAGHPFNLEASGYLDLYYFRWGATDWAWIVQFNLAAVRNHNKGFNANVWCVRGGQGVDMQ